MGQLLTYSFDNEFQFVCPIFNSTTKLAACVKLRELVWMGRKVEKRRGCQACMHSSKCPATAALDMLRTRKYQFDPYGSTTPIVGKLHAEIYERILPVQVQQQHLNKLGVTGLELELIQSANERIQKAIASAPRSEMKVARQSHTPTEAVQKRPRKVEKVAVPAPAESEINRAAATGDMSAAINANT